MILVNKFTASASEITAGAVQDYKVGTLIGTKTFGKGVVQSIYNTSDGGALKITTANTSPRSDATSNTRASSPTSSSTRPSTHP